MIDYINDYRREITAFFANSAATPQGQFSSANGGRAHYVRISNPINPEAADRLSARPTATAPTPTWRPGGYNQLLTGLNVFGSYPLHQQPAAGDRPIALAKHNFRHRNCVNPGAARREVLLHVQRPVGRRARLNRRSAVRPRARIKPSPISNHFRER